MARLQSEVLIEATQTIRLNKVLEARVGDLEERLRWSEEVRVGQERCAAAREEEFVIVKDECRLMKNMTLGHLSVLYRSLTRRGIGV